MTICFVSNYFNHHQKDLCDTLFQLIEGEFFFVETERMDKERKKLGWKEEKPEYVISYHEDMDKAEGIIMDCDAVICGGTSDRYIQKRLDAKKLIFRYEERLFKAGAKKLLDPRFIKMLIQCHYRYQKHPVYMLCASGFLGRELDRLHLYKNKKYKWGYFPPLREYDVDKLLEEKPKEHLEIMWCARYIWWKHPEWVVEIAEKLKEEEVPFHITMIGTGELFQKTAEEVERKQLKTCIDMIGSCSSDEVRAYMEKANIFLATSGREEGWGAVVNEAMNSGCVVVAHEDMGAVPYLIQNGRNGFIYASRDEAKEYIKKSIEKSVREVLPREAYKTVSDEWNGRVAGGRLYCFTKEIIDLVSKNKYIKGPMSKA